MRVIAVASQKGGTGKTTTAAAISYWAMEHGVRAMAIDMDPQGSLTHILQGNGTAPGAYELLKGSPAINLCQVRSGQPDLISASLQLAGADAEFSSRPGRDFFLKKAVEAVAAHWDLILIDTPPTLGTLLVNALTASDEVIIPVQADTFAMQSIYQLTETIDQIRQYCNQDLSVAGVLLTRYNGRTVISRDHRENLSDKCAELGLKLFDSTISEGIAVKEAQTLRTSLFDYAPKSRPAQDYMDFIRELKIGG